MASRQRARSAVGVVRGAPAVAYPMACLRFISVYTGVASAFCCRQARCRLMRFFLLVRPFPWPFGSWRLSDAFLLRLEFERSQFQAVTFCLRCGMAGSPREPCSCDPLFVETPSPLCLSILPVWLNAACCCCCCRRLSRSAAPDALCIFFEVASGTPEPAFFAG